MFVKVIIFPTALRGSKLYECSFVSALKMSAVARTHIVIYWKVFLTCLSGVTGLLHLYLRNHPLLILFNPLFLIGGEMKIFTILLKVLQFRN